MKLVSFVHALYVIGVRGQHVDSIQYSYKTFSLSINVR
jgi:hypothetical protein